MPSKTISKEALEELQDAVGEKNASADPGLLQVYSYMNSLGNAVIGVWWVPAVAVTLPSTTEEVQAILRICKKHGYKVRPHSSAWIVAALAMSSDVVLMDLRRMDNLIEINERDGYAVVEPYCSAGEQQVEIMKKGLNSHVNGAGPNASNLASATSVQGSGGTSQSMSNSERNHLGAELCLPNGEEILYIGSPGTPEAGYFCGDGPGPSLRGMLRGAIGNGGAYGVFTKCGMKCYPWNSEPFHCEGSPPFFNAKPLPNYSLRIAFWPDYDSECDALYRIGEAELVDFCTRFGAGVFEETCSVTNEEYMSMVDSQLYRNTFPKGCWTFSIAAGHPEEHDFRLKALEHIVEDTNGIIIDPADLGHDANQVTFQTAIRGAYVFKAAYMPTGAWSCFPPMSYETIDNLCKLTMPINVDIKKELIAKEAIEDDFYDNVYMSTDEHSHFGHNESPYSVELWEPKGQDLEGVVKATLEGWKKKIPIIYSPIPTEGDGFGVYASYLIKIYHMMDPERVMDAPQAMFGIVRKLDDIDELEIEKAPGKVPA
ncbi:MAG: FAD-dependent oxidoreductase [Actinobacteria bacterium]|nr:FAD-dependent oxidoreductase [Actinomycetota bacterium]